MNPSAFKLKVGGEELTPIPSPKGLIFLKDGREVALARVSHELAFPFIKTIIKLEYQGLEPAELYYWGKPLIYFSPMGGIVRRRFPQTAEILEFPVPPPFNFLTPPILVHPSQSVSGREKGWI